jgi:diketogulonate reductase-like aldo/keto reductase
MVENQALLDFVLSSEEMEQLDALTTDESLKEFKALYLKCVVRTITKP